MHLAFTTIPLLFLISSVGAQTLPVPDFSEEHKNEMLERNKNAAELFKKPIDGGIDSYSGEKKINFFDLSKNKANHATLGPTDIKNLEDTFQLKGPLETIKIISKLNDDPLLTKWLEEKANQGHVLIMWHIAERFSFTDPMVSIKWAQAAFLGTKQESKICVNQTSVKNIINDLTLKFPKASRASAVNPWRVKEGTDFALDFFMKTHPPDPTNWLCKPAALEWMRTTPKKDRNTSKEIQLITNNIFTFDPKYFNELRRRERNNFRISLKYPETSMEPTPAEFSPKK